MAKSAVVNIDFNPPRSRKIAQFIMAFFVHALSTLALTCSATAAQKTIWFALESHYPPAKESDFIDAFNQPDA